MVMAKRHSAADIVLRGNMTSFRFSIQVWPVAVSGSFVVHSVHRALGILKTVERALGYRRADLSPADTPKDFAPATP